MKAKRKLGKMNYFILIGAIQNSREIFLMQNLEATPNLSKLIQERNLKKETEKYKFLDDKNNEQKSLTHKTYFSASQDLTLPHCKHKE